MYLGFINVIRILALIVIQTTDEQIFLHTHIFIYCNAIFMFVRVFYILFSFLSFSFNHLCLSIHRKLIPNVVLF